MKRSNLIQKIITIALVSAIAVSMASCGGKKTTKNGSAAAKGGAAAEETKEGAKGRYVETAVPLPVGEGERVLDLIRTKDGAFELYSSKAEGESMLYKAYCYDGTDWSEELQFAAQGLPEGSLLLHAAYGKGGTLFVIYADADYKIHLGKFEDENPMQELPVGAKDLAASSGLYVKDNDTVLIPAGDQVFIIDASGTTVDKIPQKNPGVDSSDDHTFTAHSFLTAGDRGFIRYNSDNWKEEETIPFQNGETDVQACLDAGEGDGFYLANEKGIHHMADKGTMWETVVDGSLNSMGMPGVAQRRLFVGSSNDFFLWYYENGLAKMAHYTYDKDMLSVPSEAITVYGLDLSSNLSIKRAASLFQMENPDIRVEMIDAAETDGGTSKADAIRALNAELLNGAGADVLVLDGLPTDSYIEKGVLDDLSEMITPMIESGELYPNIAKSFTSSDGSICQYPVRVLLPVVFGLPDAVKSTASLEALKDWQGANPDKAVFSKTVYENILRQLTYLYYPELKNGSGDGFDKEKIQLLLETVKMVGDAGGCQVKFDESENGGMGAYYNAVVTDGFFNVNFFSFLNGNLSAAIEDGKGMEDMMYPFAMIEQYGYQLSQLNGTYYPNGLLGIVRAGKEKDIARRFVEFALSLKAQEDDSRDGFPVSKKASEAWAGRTSEIMSGQSMPGTDESISAKYPDEQERNEVIGMLDELHTSVAMDDTLLEMIVSETKEYFEGTQTAAESVEKFMNKVKLYSAE